MMQTIAEHFTEKVEQYDFAVKIKHASNGVLGTASMDVYNKKCSKPSKLFASPSKILMTELKC